VTKAGLPIGLQIVGKHFDDARVLWLAERFERIHPFVAPPALDP
jgi:aspartyl-tRNA(Asn)/glutamyl-tRNA(Gln) amidotransferase subunit A